MTNVMVDESSCRLYRQPLCFSFHFSVVLKLFKTKSWKKMQGKKVICKFKNNVNGRAKNKIRTQ